MGAVAEGLLTRGRTGSRVPVPDGGGGRGQSERNAAAAAPIDDSPTRALVRHVARKPGSCCGRRCTSSRSCQPQPRRHRATFSRRSPAHSPPHRAPPRQVSRKPRSESQQAPPGHGSSASSGTGPCPAHERRQPLPLQRVRGRACRRGSALRECVSSGPRTLICGTGCPAPGPDRRSRAPRVGSAAGTDGSGYHPIRHTLSQSSISAIIGGTSAGPPRRWLQEHGKGGREVETSLTTV